MMLLAFTLRSIGDLASSDQPLSLCGSTETNSHMFNQAESGLTPVSFPPQLEPPPGRFSSRERACARDLPKVEFGCIWLSRLQLRSIAGCHAAQSILASEPPTIIGSSVPTCPSAFSSVNTRHHQSSGAHFRRGWIAFISKQAGSLHEVSARANTTSKSEPCQARSRLGSARS